MPLFHHPVYHFRRAHRRAAQRFKRLTASLNPKSMQNEINRLVNTVSDPVAKKVVSRFCIILSLTTPQDFNADMQSFLHLFTRYMEGGAVGELLYQILQITSQTLIHGFLLYRDWERVKPPLEDQILSYDLLPDVPVNVDSLAKLAVLNVNGGLGTSMGRSYVLISWNLLIAGQV